MLGVWLKNSIHHTSISKEETWFYTHWDLYNNLTQCTIEAVQYSAQCSRSGAQRYGIHHRHCCRLSQGKPVSCPLHPHYSKRLKRLSSFTLASVAFYSRSHSWPFQPESDVLREIRAWWQKPPKLKTSYFFYFSTYFWKMNYHAEMMKIWQIEFKSLSK